jgi:hypothetical protein
MTPEARLAFVLFFFVVWCFLGLIAWAGAAVVARGRGALPALPLALACACASGMAIPLAGLNDFAGFLLSLAVAFVAGALASVAGIRLARRLGADGLSTDSRQRGAVRAQSGQQDMGGETD